MSRAIIIILLIGLAFWAALKMWRGISGRAASRTEPVFEKTVRCAQCGVHVSVQLAQERNGQHYCCPEHLPPE